MTTKKKVLLIVLAVAGLTLLGFFLPDMGKSSDDVVIREEKFSGYEEKAVGGVIREDNTKQETEEVEELSGYIGNKKSKKFHRPECETLPHEKNREYFDDREQAVDMGYNPCKNCKP